MLGLTIRNQYGEIISHSGLDAGLHEDEMAELTATGSVRRVLGNVVMCARTDGRTIVQMLR